MDIYLTLFFVIAIVISLYALVSVINLLILAKIHKRVCPICAAVLSTWLILLILWIFGLGNPILIGILAGQSVIGVLHVLEKMAGEKRLRRNSLIQLSTVIFGTSITFFLIEKLFLIALITMAVFFLELLIIFANKKDNKIAKPLSNEVSEKLSSDLERCCD